MLKPSQNPPMLPAGVVSVADLAGDWWVAHTRARNEKALAWDLHKRGIGYYLPMKERVCISGGRKRRVVLPLFASYTFICGSALDRYQAMTTNRISGTITVDDPARLVAELTYIERVLQGDAELDFYPEVATGQLCQVTAGPFKGIEGIVVRRGRKARVVIEVSMIGQGAAVEVDADLLEPVADYRGDTIN